MPTVLVTGASRGIGRAIAGYLAGRGWTVHAGIRAGRDGESLVTEFGANVRPVQLDITSAANLASLPEVLGDELDALVNNAGIVVQGPVETVSVDDLRRQLEVNVVAQHAITQALLPSLRANHGRIVFISSLSGRVSTPLSGAYNSSKFALEGLADALRVELRPWHIPVVLVEPGPTATDMWATALEQHQQTISALSPAHHDLYAAHLGRSTRAMRLIQKRTVPAERVARTVEIALTARRPKARYVVDFGGRAQLVGKALTPTRMLDAVLGRATGFS